ncbi:ribonuclease P protein component [Candidatus Erwinia haradaeae]|uniref:Ribonuclease P protein component n=1 Tax=Candidatus Erwinia haradaeae TaxID=1922217 RepID=A0A451D7F6_9GAMM|nr:ribonuclease P protein component [Candidatus Erwinia haradaeae]VFP81758.1 Ribonuclease P protein component [Candidatus Erwinia haradaeae]
MSQFGLSRELRLLTTRHFKFVFEYPKRVSTRYITILSRFNKRNHPRIGLTVSKKNIKYAHERNRVKRLIRDSFRKNQYQLAEMDFIVIAKIGVSKVDNNELTGILERLWHHHYRLHQKY